MNKLILMGRLTRDPEIRYGGSTNTCIARFSLAVDRRFKKDGGPTADFFNCTAFGRLGEFVGKYLYKGTKIVLDGEIQNNNYQNKEGQTVYGFQVIANSIEFAESKKATEESRQEVQSTQSASKDLGGDGWAHLDDIDDELPFV